MLTESYYRSAWAAGKLRVEGQKEWPIDRPLRAGMCLRHFLHRHEPPVLAASVQVGQNLWYHNCIYAICKATSAVLESELPFLSQVVGENTDFVAVNKPACLPVHAVGQYRKNTGNNMLQ